MADRKVSMVVFLRRALLAIVVLTVCGVAGLFLFGQVQSSDVERSSAPSIGRGEELEEGLAGTSQDFDFTLRQEGRPVFHIHGDKSRSDQDDNVFLEGVRIILPRSDGDYEVTSNVGTYDQREQEAKLEGNVVVSGPQDIEMRTEWLDLRDGGNVLVASVGTDFNLGKQVFGHAENLRIDLASDVVILSGGVQMDGGPGLERPFSLSAESVLFQREEQRLKAEGDVVIDRDGDHLEAKRISLFFDDAIEQVRFLRALWMVRGKLVSRLDPELPGQRVEFHGRILSVLFGEDGAPQRIELEGTHEYLASLYTTEEVPRRTAVISAVFLAAKFVQGVLQSAESLGSTRLKETVAAGGEVLRRTASAGKSEASFDRLGHLTGVTLEEDVELVDGRVEAVADRAYVDALQQRLEMHGTPVTVHSASGELVAPQVTYTRPTGLLHAKSGVRALLEDVSAKSVSALPLIGGDEPVRVEAEEAYLRESPQSFLFRGDVRAWQGNNRLQADQLRGEGGERMSASGEVKTLWHPSVEGDAGDAPDRLPIEIRAKHMSYSDAEGVLLYHTDVGIRQAGRLLTCEETTVELNERRDAEVIECQGKARLLDPASRSSIEGDRAMYSVSRRDVEFFGDPIVIRTPEGRYTSRYAFYSLESGDFRTTRSIDLQPSG